MWRIKGLCLKTKYMINTAKASQEAIVQDRVKGNLKAETSDSENTEKSIGKFKVKVFFKKNTINKVNSMYLGRKCNTNIRQRDTFLSMSRTLTNCEEKDNSGGKHYG